MLRLTGEQIDDMNRRAADRSDAILAQILREEIPPDRLGTMSDEELLALTRHAGDQARASGLTRDEDIDLYVYARAYFGPSFPGEMPELQSTLTDARLPWEVRAGALAEAMTEADQ